MRDLRLPQTNMRQCQLIYNPAEYSLLHRRLVAAPSIKFKAHLYHIFHTSKLRNTLPAAVVWIISVAHLPQIDPFIRFKVNYL